MTNPPVVTEAKGPFSEGRFHPRNPIIGLGLGTLLLLAGIAGSVVFALDAGRVIHGEVHSSRASGFILVGPFLFLAVSVITLVRGVRAVRPWVVYRAKTPLAQRRRDRARDLTGQARWPLITVGGVALVGQIVLLAAVRRLDGTTSATTFAEVQLLLLIVWVSTLGLLAQTIWFRRFAQNPEIAQPR